MGGSFHFPIPFSGYLRFTGKNLARIASFIKSENPDIVGLVEVDSGSYRSGKYNQADILARALGHYYVYQSKYGTHFYGKFPLLDKQGNAFLTKHTIQNQKFHYFSKGIKRLVIELELEQCTIFLVHLSLRFHHRRYQLNDLLSLFKQTKKPVIVAGDFNLLHGRIELQTFLNATGLINANRQHLPTFPSRFPHRELDFILHSRNIKITGFRIPRILYSDHNPVICDFKIT